MEKFGEVWAEHVGWPQVRQERGVFLSMPRRIFARLFALPMGGIVAPWALSLLSRVLLGFGFV